jgi:competence protein ComEA
MNTSSQMAFVTFVRSMGFVLALGALAIPHADAQRREPPASGSARTEAGPAVRGDAAPAPSEGVVNVQTATLEELQRLPGIGPSKAAAIVAFRERTAFRRIEDVMRVRGIGRATFRRLRTMLSVSGPTTLSTDVRAPRVRASDETDDDAQL